MHRILWPRRILTSSYDATYLQRGVTGRRSNYLDRVVALAEKLVIMRELVKKLSIYLVYLIPVNFNKFYMLWLIYRIVK
jgi:hypothetical protein